MHNYSFYLSHSFLIVCHVQVMGVGLAQLSGVKKFLLQALALQRQIKNTMKGSTERHHSIIEPGNKNDFEAN